MSQSMLSRGLGGDFSVQDPADWIRGEECCAKGFVRLEGIDNLEDAGFSAIAVRFGSFEFFCLPANLRCGREDLPGCEQNFKSINNCEGFLNRLARTLQIAFCQRHSGLQLPPERLQMRIAGGQRGL